MAYNTFWVIIGSYGMCLYINDENICSLYANSYYARFPQNQSPTITESLAFCFSPIHLCVFHNLSVTPTDHGWPIGWEPQVNKDDFMVSTIFCFYNKP